MTAERFQNFFRTALADGRLPFDYQTRLACGEDGRGRECASLLIDVPTGCGKTAAVLLAWLWNRLAHPDAAHRETWPRRLVYCLPMRSLVEQTCDAAELWLKNLKDAGLIGEVDLRMLMGGAEQSVRSEWDLHPGHDAILVGTQDMLLSRALNRGYGLSRYRWSVHFGLLNNDCLWTLDETQLMGVGVETSAQLDAFRQRTIPGAPTRAFTWWMSATLAPAQLETVDHPRPSAGWPTLELSDQDKAPGSTVQTRRTAVKRLARAPVAAVPGDKGDYAKTLAAFIHERHRVTTEARQASDPPILTLVVLNRVSRAREVYQALLKLRVLAEKLALIHSRLRPGDRQRHEKILFAKGTDRIVVATQAVEAGVDVSARVLVTELAPWPSLVQRFGRCNREGEWPGGTDVFWIDVQPKDDKDDLRLPYACGELEIARGLLAAVEDVGIGTLHEVNYAPPLVIRSVIRRKDLLDLFDTTADLLGHDLDVSRYVRDSDDTDVQVFWREFVPGNTRIEEPAPTRVELCRVSLADFRHFLPKAKAFVWDGLETKSWQPATKARPGQIYLLPISVGGYENLLGWTGKPVSKDGRLTPCPPPAGSEPPSTDDGSRLSLHRKTWVLLADHTTHVRTMLDEVLRGTLPLTDGEAAALRDAALWHDVGKAHWIFQKLLQDAVTEANAAEACRDPGALWAKSAGTKPFASPGRKGFRHELASALAWLQQAPDTAARRDLTAFLIASHHGRVRRPFRSLPEESPRPEDPDRLYARGVWDRDPLPPESFPEEARGSLPADGFKLDLGYMLMGDRDGHGPSWLARMLALRNSCELGPFRLAYLETLLRAADMRASAQEAMQP